MMDGPKTYISLGTVKVDVDTLLNMFGNATKATKGLITKTFRAAHQLPLEPASIGLHKNTLVAELSMVSQLLQIQNKSLIRRLSRSSIFAKTDSDHGTVWILEYDNETGSLGADHSQLKRSVSLNARKSVEDKHRKRPPLKDCPDMNLMVSLPLGDISALSVPSKTIVHTRRFMINMGKDKAVVLASGGNGIIDKDDMKTLYALISQTIQYHTVYQGSFSRDGEMSNNVTPIYADTILNIIGRKQGDVANRKYLWRQIVKIRTTEYDVHSLTPFFDDNDRSLFKNNQFRFIIDTPSLSESALDLANDQDASPSVYEIIWHPVVFKAIFNNKSLFAFPESVFREPTQIFSLYLELRNRMQYAGPAGIKINKQELMDILLDGGCEYDFQKSFFSSFAKTASKSLREELKKARDQAKRLTPIEVERDFFGFNITLIVTGKTTFSEMIITFILKDVLQHCGVKMNTRGGNSSPSLPNKLYSTGQALSKLNTKEPVPAKELTGMQLWRKAKKIFDAINAVLERTPYALRLTVESIELDLIIIDTTGDNTIVETLASIEQRFSIDPSEVSQYLISAKNGLRGLSFNYKQITKEQVIELRRALNKEGRQMSIEEMVYHLATNDLLRKRIAEHGVTPETVDVISYILPA
ncbi:replication initiator protein RctB domain-containing protein [Oceanisphaera sp. IT1-181]|uniref:replication initiator protein RctB domain-containing protein n=1 Tax=Oceanisphaera sp. IT1-181 TaxID=3081199 RepID=UPI0029CA4D49|nr:replication initiator protein RctB domain-containing protein [Oceanisphaera sp. IT1-181]